MISPTLLIGWCLEDRHILIDVFHYHLFVLNTLMAASSSMDAVNGKNESEHKLGVLILIPMRLGAGTLIEADHLPTLLKLLEDPLCVGLIGGRPRHSVYVAGVQSDHLIYLDPHFCQEAVDFAALSEDDEFDESVSLLFKTFPNNYKLVGA